MQKSVKMKKLEEIISSKRERTAPLVKYIRYYFNETLFL